MTGLDPLRVVREYASARERLVIGLMTGTSADAVDAVLVRFRGPGLEAAHEVLAELELPLPRELRAQILDVASSASVPLERVMELDANLGTLYADCVSRLLERSRHALADVSAVGIHGQTVRHVPRSARAGSARTLQLGSAAILAETSGLTVVSNFRARDTAAGGEGAPLVPIADWWLFRSSDESRVLLNLGGMANVTYLPRGGALDRVIAFDTGPGNAVLDALVELATGGSESFDRGGERAARGSADPALLQELLSDPFFAEPPPRSTGRERFGAAYARRLAEIGASRSLTPDDVLATATELTAASVAGAILAHLEPRPGVDAVYASGGGVRNPTLLAALARRLAPVPVRPLGSLGVASDSKEALAFAFLAHLTLCGVPGNVPSATGARRAVVLGQITPGGSN